MAIVAGQLFAQTDADTAIDTILTQEANRIGPDIHRRTVNVSPWLNLIKQAAFPDGMGYTLGTLIYERALPTTDVGGSALGLSWADVGAGISASNILSPSSSLSQLLTGAADTMTGPVKNGTAGKSFIAFSRQLKQYTMKRAVVESPRINVEDLRFAAYRTEQLRAVMDALTESTRWSWEERYRDEYDRVCKNVAVCNASGGTLYADQGINATRKEGTNSWDLVYTSGTATYTVSSAFPTGNISNKVMDSIYFKQIRAGAGTNAYGRENGRPVLCVVLSSEASYSLQTEAGFRDDIRYNSSKVSDLIAPLGVEKSFRGYYHLIDDTAPRFSADTDTDEGGADTADGTLNRVYPYTASSGIITVNTNYDSAAFEAAYVVHQDVMEAQIPNPISGGNGVAFDPVNYRGKFSWKNIPDEVFNPDGTIGFFRGVLASATKPIRTEFGWVILFKRDTATLAS
jgi:hypothetical protein